MTLHGYTLPQSTSGEASLVPPPPWYFSGDVLMVEYRADPDVARALLPEGVTPDPDARAAAIFGDWQSCSADGEELRDPVRAQYLEFYVALACTVRGRPMSRCVFCWVDRDFSLVRGLVQGYPKKLGALRMIRPAVVGRAGPRVAPGARFDATLAASDRRLVDLHVDLERPVEQAPMIMTDPMLHTRLLPSWAAGGDRVHELVSGGSRDQEVADVWEGTGHLAYHEAPGEELHRLAPVEILRGNRFAFAETIDRGELIRPLGR